LRISTENISLPWSTAFDDPIELSDGRQLSTLNDAANHIMSLPEAEHWQAEWQVAMEALILVAEKGGPTMLARIGVVRALNRHVAIIYNPELKMPHLGKRKLKRDEQSPCRLN
jgi:hypothetical protein